MLMNLADGHAWMWSIFFEHRKRGAHSDRIEIGDIEEHIEPVISAGVANSQPTNFLIDVEDVPDCSSNGILKIGPNGPLFDQPHDLSSQLVPYSVGATRSAGLFAHA
jgi:hypothetical protein